MTSWWSEDPADNGGGVIRRDRRRVPRVRRFGKPGRPRPRERGSPSTPAPRTHSSRSPGSWLHQPLRACDASPPTGPRWQPASMIPAQLNDGNAGPLVHPQDSSGTTRIPTAPPLLLLPSPPAARQRSTRSHTPTAATPLSSSQASRSPAAAVPQEAAFRAARAFASATPYLAGTAAASQLAV